MIVSSRKLARNVIYNLLGHGAPLLVALVAIPLLIRGLGAERFGILTLAWAAIGYFGLFDLGIGRALTQALSAALVRGLHDEPRAITSTALLLLTGLGTAGAALLAGAAPWLIGDVLKIPGSLRHESVAAFQLLALSLPFVVTTAGLRGVLEAHQDFGAATALRLPFAVFTFLGPVLVLPYSRSLVAVVGVLVLGRLLLWAAHLAVVQQRYAGISMRALHRGAHVRALLRLGGWMTVSNIISPIMGSIDRFWIAGIIGTTAVAYYATAYEVAIKLLVIPGAVVGVLFPAFAATFTVDPHATERRAEQAVRLLVTVMFPLSLTLVAVAPEALEAWVGRDFSQVGTPVLRWLAAGVLINSIGQVPFGTLQGMGRADLTARLHLIELPLYLAMLWVLASWLGVTGVAVAWTLRVAADTTILLVLVRRKLPPAPGVEQLPWPFIALLLGAMAAVGSTTSAAPRFALATLVLLAFAASAWHWVLRPAERAVVRSLGRARPTVAG